MLPLRLLFAAIFLVSLPFGLCSSSEDSPEVTDQTKALTAAIVSIGDDPNPLPPIGQSYDCVIHVTHQPPAPQSPFHDVKGSCLWTPELQGNVWLVSFSETWLCDDWAATVPNYRDCIPPTGTHRWQYQVDLQSGSALEISNGGPYAPDQH